MRYPGGKNNSGVYQRIINLMPPHSVYVEPFLGSGAVLRHKRPALVTIGVDRSRAAVGAVRTELLGAGWDVSPLARVFNNGPMRSCDLVFGDGLRVGGACPGRQALLGIGNGIRFLDRLEFAPTDLVYVDPPYLRSSRQSSRSMYEFEMTDEHHRHLLEVLLALPCFVIVSGYMSPLYRRALRGWRVLPWSANTRGGGRAWETLWMNFPAPSELHDYRFLGEDYRERERLKRIKTRWASRLERMPQLERLALMAALRR